MNKDSLNRFPHICSLLKNIRWNFHNYIEENEIPKEESKIIFLIDLCLDQVLITNQHMTNSLTTLVRTEMCKNKFYEDHLNFSFPYYLKNKYNTVKKYEKNEEQKLIKDYGWTAFYEKYPKGIFPHYLRKEGHQLVEKYGDEIIEKLENISKINIDRNITTDDFYDHLFSDEDLLDISKPYNDIILLQREIKREIIPYDRLEYGAFLGLLLKKVIDRYRALDYDFIEAGRKLLLGRALGFKKQTEGSKERQYEEFDNRKANEL